ncbi:MAG TPA: hypothetical protein V6D03_13495, partial [Candidatus Caenarcaniphilales bacterium]
MANTDYCLRGAAKVGTLILLVTVRQPHQILIDDTKGGSGSGQKQFQRQHGLAEICSTEKFETS